MRGIRVDIGLAGLDLGELRVVVQSRRTVFVDHQLGRRLRIVERPAPALYRAFEEVDHDILVVLEEVFTGIDGAGGFRDAEVLRIERIDLDAARFKHDALVGDVAAISVDLTGNECSRVGRRRNHFDVIGRQPGIGNHVANQRHT